uniref:non-specific serine/threonine protein kinase n=1 Tax=Quercus lobata TaxID=97700 RepID=A0A7N2MCL6_QUELO
MKIGAITVIKGWSSNCMLCSMFILYIPVLLCSSHVYCADRVSLRYVEWIKDHEETLVSPGRKFELGFFSPAGSSCYRRYVGIWYMWDKRTVCKKNAKKFQKNLSKLFCEKDDLIAKLNESNKLVEKYKKLVEDSLEKQKEFECLNMNLDAKLVLSKKLVDELKCENESLKMHVKCLIAEPIVKKDDNICCNHVVVPDFVPSVCSTLKDKSVYIPPHKRNQKVERKTVNSKPPFRSQPKVLNGSNVRIFDYSFWLLARAASKLLVLATQFGDLQAASLSCEFIQRGDSYSYDSRAAQLLDLSVIVWVANRDDPLINTTTGAFGFTTDGNLMVLDTSSGKVHWYSERYYSCNPCNTTDKIVNLTDSGNLVLYGYSYEYGNVTSLWESFKNPTDTFLPGMTLPLDGNINLTSWRGRDDPGSGNFTFMLDATGNRNAIVANKEGTTIYWKSSVGLFTFLTTTEVQNDADFENARLVMNFTGKIEHWVQNTNGTWYLSDAEPSNNCSMYNACGNFGSCNLNKKLKCKCLPGFKPYVAQKWHSGDFSDGCTKNSVSCGNTFLSLKMMKIGKNLEQRSWVENETECKELCLKHCECKSYSYNRGSEMPCWIWKQELVNLQEEYEGGYNISIRVAISDIEPTVQNCKPCGTNTITYPLSTNSNCGDPMYFSFNCNTTSGQVSFKAPRGAYRVTSIDQNTTKFFIQVKDVGSLRLNQSLPFNQTTPRNSSSNVLSRVTDDVEIVWEPPLEPICNLSADCKDWPHSTCISAVDGKRRCLCTKSF